MPQHVAFLRAINVGGRGKIKMDELRRLFTDAGARDVATYIQSGNVIFSASAKSAEAIVRKAAKSLEKVLGHAPPIMLRSAAHIAKLCEASPFAALEPDPTVKWYVAFLTDRPSKTLARGTRSEKEALELVDVKGAEAFIISSRKKNGFYGFPNNFIESELGVSATSRNWTTLNKIHALLGS